MVFTILNANTNGRSNRLVARFIFFKIEYIWSKIDSIMGWDENECIFCYITGQGNNSCSFCNVCLRCIDDLTVDIPDINHSGCMEKLCKSNENAGQYDCEETDNCYICKKKGLFMCIPVCSDHGGPMTKYEIADAKINSMMYMATSWLDYIPKELIMHILSDCVKLKVFDNSDIEWKLTKW
jgi:hypothetical protein